MASSAVLIKACLNGGRARGSHAALPISPADLVREAAGAAAAGAGAAHVHPRDSDGRESHRPEDVALAVVAIRLACPGLPIGVTTGAWIVNSPSLRLQQVGGWRELPDFASVNWSEDGALELAELLLSRGIGVEIGLFTIGDAEAFAVTHIAGRCLRVLVEVRERDGIDAVTQAAAIDRILDAEAIDLPRLHHGFGPDTWHVLDAALRLGGDVRIGLEDTFTLPDGRQARDNAELVASAVTLARKRGREPARVAGESSSAG